jgi:hypothetical protein
MRAPTTGYGIETMRALAIFSTTVPSSLRAARITAEVASSTANKAIDQATTRNVRGSMAQLSVS